MTFPLTLTTNLVRKQTNLKPQIVFSIDGVATKFGAISIYEYIRIGDDGLYIDNFEGDTWTIGGLKPLIDQGEYIMLGTGTTTKITQQLDPSKGIGTSITNMNITLMDKVEEISRLISPGFDVNEILGRKCTVEIGFQNTAYPQDYITVFRGIIEDIQSGPGNVAFSLSSSEQKKRQTVFTTFSGKLTAAMDVALIQDQQVKYSINDTNNSSATVQLVEDAQHQKESVSIVGTALTVHIQPVGPTVNLDFISNRIRITGHYFELNDRFQLDNVAGITGGTTGINTSTNYYVVDVLNANEFRVGTKEGGPFITLGTNNGTALLRRTTAATVARVINDDGDASQVIVASNYGTSSTIVNAAGPFAFTFGLDTVVTLDNVDNLLEPITGPDGLEDSSISFFIRIGDEILGYTGISGLSLTGVTRGEFGTTPIPHDVDADVSPIVRLEGNGLDLARKIMMSGFNGPYLTGVLPTHFVNIDPVNQVTNAIFFYEVDVSNVYGLYAGDYITTIGASNGANNVTLKQIESITQTNDGSYIVISGVSFVAELNTTASISFRSQWDTFPDGCRMTADDVDLAEFDFLHRTFLSSFDFDFRLTDSKEARGFIEDQIFRPMAAFSIQRKGRSSVGYHIGPIPGAELLLLNQDNIENASRLKIRRTISKNYYNTVEYNFDQDVLTGEFATVKVRSDSTSVDDFNIGQRSLVIQSEGMRSSLQGATKALQASNRLLNRYKRAAEFLDGVEVRYGDAFNSEIGDINLLDTRALSITDIKTGSRQGTTRIFQVLNKSLDMKMGKVTVNLVDTNYSTASRYGLVSPASKVKSGSSTTVFVIKSSYSSKYGASEYLKWQRFGQVFIRVKSPDGVSRDGIAQIESVIGNTVTLQTALSFTPQADDIMEFAPYNYATDQQKLAYAFMRDTGPFDDGKPVYNML